MQTYVPSVICNINGELGWENKLYYSKAARQRAPFLQTKEWWRMIGVFTTSSSVRKRRKTTLASPQRCSYREATYVIFREPHQNQQLNYLVLIPLTHLVLLLVLVLRVSGGVREQLPFQHPNDFNEVRHSNGATQCTQVSCCSNIKTTQTRILMSVTGLVLLLYRCWK